MKWDRSSLITLVYGLFVLLYAIFIAGHPGHFGHRKGAHWGYFLGFLGIATLVFFVVQGLALRTKRWAWVFLLPLLLLAAAILAGYLFVGLLRLGGGDLLDRDMPDMLLVTGLLLVGSIFSLRLIRK